MLQGGSSKPQLHPIADFEGLTIFSVYPLVEWEGTRVLRRASDVAPFVWVGADLCVGEGLGKGYVFKRLQYRLCGWSMYRLRQK